MKGSEKSRQSLLDDFYEEKIEKVVWYYLRDVFIGESVDGACVGESSD